MAQKGDLLSFRPDIKVLDATIRDGGLVNDFYFTDEFIKDLYQTNVKAGVDYMEFGYRADKEMFDDLTDYEKSIIENKLSFWKTILYNENHKLISKEKSYFIPLKTDTILGKTNGNNAAIDFKIFGDKNKFETEYAITYVKIPFIIISTEVWGIRKRFRKYRVGHHIKSISYNKLPIEVKRIIDNQQRSFYESMKDISPIQIQKIKERAIKSIKDDN